MAVMLVEGRPDLPQVKEVLLRPDQPPKPATLLNVLGYPERSHG
jgi:hypothetical protein